MKLLLENPPMKKTSLNLKCLCFFHGILLIFSGRTSGENTGQLVFFSVFPIGIHISTLWGTVRTETLPCRCNVGFSVVPNLSTHCVLTSNQQPPPTGLQADRSRTHRSGPVLRGRRATRRFGEEADFRRTKRSEAAAKPTGRGCTSQVVGRPWLFGWQIGGE